jgi:prepilin-type N-terminal cleavage/methylation domain-containing protein
MRGFTLVELMIVVAIVGILSGVALFALAPTGNAQDAAALARSLHFAMQRARVDAASDNRQRRLSCNATLPQSCVYQMATTVGMSGTVAFQNAGDNIQAGRHAQVYNVTPTTDAGVDNSGARMSGPQTITFYPNGTASAATVYVSDTNATPSSKYKIFVFAGTGLARLADQW